VSDSAGIITIFPHILRSLLVGAWMRYVTGGFSPCLGEKDVKHTSILSLIGIKNMLK